ncbi:MAG: nucleotidyltransferase domain-containing protein [Elusimicrobia bacterium]|nr:nucleotidyltransferase domain-containing protein [Elusimicrobiota bacterium]
MPDSQKDAVRFFAIIKFMGDKEVEKWAINEARKTVRRILKGVRIRAWFFGSRANGNARRFSDIDIALDGRGKHVPDEVMNNLYEAIEESLIPFRVEIMDMSKLNKDIKNKIKHEGRLWKD